MRVRIVPVNNSQPLTVRRSPGGSEIGRVSMGSTGTVVPDSRNGDGAQARGEYHTWVCIDFDGGPTGFVAEEHVRGIGGGGGGGGRGGGGGGCFITTAACSALGKPDDGLTLTALRALRDEHMLTTDQGRASVAEYYAQAPCIVAQIDSRADAAEIYADLSVAYLHPAAKLTLRGEFKAAELHYAAMMTSLRERLAS